jgi:hypothetical protein
MNYSAEHIKEGFQFTRGGSTVYTITKINPVNGQVTNAYRAAMSKEVYYDNCTLGYILNRLNSGKWQSVSPVFEIRWPDFTRGQLIGLQIQNKLTSTIFKIDYPITNSPDHMEWVTLRSSSFFTQNFTVKRVNEVLRTGEYLIIATRPDTAVLPNLINDTYEPY